MKIEDALRELEGHETGIRHKRLLVICEAFFGKPRVKGSHHYFATPWQGDPVVNLPKPKGSIVKPCYVRNVIKALQRLKRCAKADSAPLDISACYEKHQEAKHAPALPTRTVRVFR